METRCTKTILSLSLLLAILSLLPQAFAASQILQQKPKPPFSAPQNQPAFQNPNAPPQGSIAITTPTSGKTWHTGSYQIIQWACTGMRYTTVDVSLWKDGRLFADIGKRVGTGRTAYIIPFDAAAGFYELRVTSDTDTRIEAKMPVTVAVTRINFVNPVPAMVSGSPYTIKWTHSANLSGIKISVLDDSGAVVQEYPNVPPGAGGNGSWSWHVPLPPSGKTSVQYRFSATGRFHADVTNNNAWVDRILGQSSLFTVRLPKILVGSFGLTANVAQCSPGRTYQQSWNSELNGRPVKIELCNASSGKAVHTIQASTPSQEKNAITWTAPNIPATLSREGLTVTITSLDNPAIKASGGTFSCEKPWITLVSPDPQKNLQMNNSYQIGWKYYGDPGPHVRVDLLSAKNQGYNMQVFETPAQNTPVQGTTGKWGEGQISWKLTNRGPQSQFYIQIRGIEDPNIYDRKQYYIGGSSGSSGTSTGTVTTGSSTTTTTTTTPTTTGSNSTERLTYDAVLKYNATDSAKFQKNTSVVLNPQGQVIEGYLYLGSYSQELKYNSGKSVKMQPGSKVTFSNGYLTSGLITLDYDQMLEYGPGRTTKFQAGTMTTFSKGYVVSSFIALTVDHTLEYRPGKSTKFQPGSKTAFSDGYVTSSFLALPYDHTLEYRTGKTATFRAGALTTFNSTAILSSLLAMKTEQSLEYKPGKFATFTSTTPITFRADGYVKSCMLANATSLEYAPGKSHTWPAGTWPIFNDEGFTTTH